MTFETFIANLPWWVFLLLILWSIPWKGIALWKSARKRSVVWFTVLLIVNTLGILEILYIFLFSRCCEKKTVPAKTTKAARRSKMQKFLARRKSEDFRAKVKRRK
jgi:methionyl-tRNA synthetase